MVTSGKCGCGADLATGDGDGRCQMCRYELMQIPVSVGWICPICGAALAPSISECYHCRVDVPWTVVSSGCITTTETLANYATEMTENRPA